MLISPSPFNDYHPNNTKIFVQIDVDQLTNECMKLAQKEKFLEKELERTRADLAASEEELSGAREDASVLQSMPEESLDKLLSDQTKIPSVS